MKKLLLTILCLLGASAVFADVFPIDTLSPKNQAFQYIVRSTNVYVSTTPFSKNLGVTDTNLQHALQTLDQLSTGGGGGASVNVSPHSVLFSTGGTTISGDTGFQYDNTVSSITLAGAALIGGNLQVNPYGSHNNLQSLYFNPSEGILHNNYEHIGFPRGGFQVETYGTPQVFWGSDGNTDFVIKVPTDSVAGLTNRISIRNSNSTSQLIQFNENNFGYTLQKSSLTFLNGGTNPILDWAVSNQLRLNSNLALSNLTNATSLATDSTGKIIAGTGGGGGGASTLAVGTGTASNFTNNITSPTAAVSFLGAQFQSLALGTTNVIQLNQSSVTVQGNTFNASNLLLKADSNAFVTMASSLTLTTIQPANATNPISAAPISIIGGQGGQPVASGTGGFGSTITVRAGDGGSGTTGGTGGGILILAGNGQPQGAGGNGGSITINAGTGTVNGSVYIYGSTYTINGALAVNSLTDAGLTSGQCVQAGTGGLLTVTGSACGAGGGGGSSIYPATGTASFPYGMTLSTINATAGNAGITISTNVYGTFYQQIYASQFDIGKTTSTTSGLTTYPYISNSTNEYSPAIYFDNISTQSVTKSFRVHNYDGRTLYADMIFDSTATTNYTCWSIQTSTMTLFPLANYYNASVNSQNFSVPVTTAIAHAGTSYAPMIATVSLSNTTAHNLDMLTIFLMRRTDACGNAEAVAVDHLREVDIYENQ